MHLTNDDPDSTNSSTEENTNLWQSILNDVQKHGNLKLNPNKQIVVLGDNESGKTTMVAKLQGIENSSKGSGLEYAYINVRDDYRDDLTRLSVWVLDGDPAHVDLLKFALNEENFQDTLIILTVSMTTPWGILEQLQHWSSVLADHLDKLKLDIDIRQNKRYSMIKKWLEYVEPGDELEPASPMKRSSRNLGEDDEEIDSSALPEGTLTTNLGLDMVVVVTKTDYIQTLEKEQDYRDEHLDFMQQWIRKFCLQHGAALFYTSAKEDKNCDLLYKYLTHRIYGFPFHTPALVVEKDAVFIPAGWDNIKKISILFENMHSCKPDDYYRDVIVQPATRKVVNRETELVAEDEQAFLSRLQQSAFGGPPPVGARLGESPVRPGPVPVMPPGSRKIDHPNKMVNTTTAGEGVLANFFNSLLHKKPGSPNTSMVNKSGSESLTEKAMMRSDAQAELDKLSRKKLGQTPSGATTPNNSGVDFDATDC